MIEDLEKKIAQSKKKINKEEERFRVYSAHEVVDPYIEKVRKSKDKPVMFGIKAFDDLFDGDLRGQLAGYLGYGGTKKSLFSLNNANVNAEVYKSKTVYSSQEMGKERLLSRMLDYAIDYTYDGATMRSIRATSIIKDRILDGEDVADELKTQLRDFYGDRVLISDSTRMTIQDYRRLITENKPDILVVDGLSRMGGQGGETELYSNNSGDLKDLCVEFDIFCILICHCSKSSGGVAGTKTTRDLTRYVRGSEKILDNVDFTISFSLCEKTDGTYDNKYGWMQLNDKRNTGKTINQIYEFDELKLIMNDCHLDPRSFETKSKKDKYEF